MAIATRKCKICGKEYEYCHSARRSEVFRWQDVACSPEHGSIYFAKIAASRANKAAVQRTVDNAECVVGETERCTAPLEDEKIESDKDDVKSVDEVEFVNDNTITESDEKRAKRRNGNKLIV